MGFIIMGKYRVKILKFNSIVGIGMDDAECRHINANYTLEKRGGELKHYSYLSIGGLYQWGNNNKCIDFNACFNVSSSSFLFNIGSKKIISSINN